MKILWNALLVMIAVSLALPALAEEGDSLAGSKTSPWGIRVGLGTDPDQIIGGVNFLETKIANNVYLVPNAELGFGDDHVIVAGTAPVFYRFVTQSKVRPYAGGGVTIGFDRKDKNDGGSETNLEIALQASGGVIWKLKSGTEMFGELNLSFGDLHEMQAMIGWRF